MVVVSKETIGSNGLLCRREYRSDVVVCRFGRLGCQWEVSNWGDEVFDVEANAMD